MIQFQDIKIFNMTTTKFYFEDYLVPNLCLLCGKNNRREFNILFFVNKQVEKFLIKPASYEIIISNYLK